VAVTAAFRRPTAIGAASATPPAALSGSYPKAPGFAGGYLLRYPLGEKGVPPEPNFDPGRVRYLPLFNKMYGDCRSADFMTNATNVLLICS